MSSKHTSIRRNAVWATLGTASTVAAQIATIVVLARLLTPYEFGIVSAAALVTQLAVIFSEFGVGPYVVQRRELTESFMGTAFRISCGLGAIMAIGLWFIAPVLAPLLHAPELALALRPYAAVFLIASFAAVNDALIQRDLDYKYLALADSVSFAVGYAGLSILCAVLGFSYWSLIIGHVGQSLIRCLIVRRKHSRLASYPASRDDARAIMRFGLGQTLSRLASYIGSQADSFIVANRLGVSAIGFYGRANQLVTMPAAQLGQIFDKLLFPMIARVQNDVARAGAAYRAAIGGISLLSIPMSALIWILGEKIVHIALGMQWQEVVDPMRVLALAIPFRLIHKVSDPTARAFGETYRRAWRQWLFAAVVIVSTLLLSPHGLGAVAWGVVGAAALDSVLMLWLCCKLTKLSVAELLRAFIPGIQAGIAAAILAVAVVAVSAPWHLNEFVVLVLATLIPLSAVAFLVNRYRLSVR